MNKTKEEIIDKVYADANNQLFSVPKQLGCMAMQAYATQQLTELLTFIAQLPKDPRYRTQVYMKDGEPLIHVPGVGIYSLPTVIELFNESKTVNT